MNNWLPYGVGAVGGLVLFFLGRLLWLDRANTKAKARAYDALITRVAAWDVRWATLSSDISPLWQTLQKKLGADLTHPDEPETDALIAKLLELNISNDERERLKLRLKQRIDGDDPKVSDSERASARIMLEVMGKVLEEAADTSALVDVKLIGTKDVQPPV